MVTDSSRMCLNDTFCILIKGVQRWWFNTLYMHDKQDRPYTLMSNSQLFERFRDVVKIKCWELDKSVLEQFRSKSPEDFMYDVLKHPGWTPCILMHNNGEMTYTCPCMTFKTALSTAAWIARALSFGFYPTRLDKALFIRIMVALFRFRAFSVIYI